MITLRKVEGSESVRSGFVKVCVSYLALLLFWVRASEQIDKSNILSGISIGFGLSYSDSYGENDMLRFCMQTNHGIWKIYDRNEYKLPSIQKTTRYNIDPSISFGYSFFKNNWYIGIIGEFSFDKNSKTYQALYSEMKAKSEISGFCSTFKLKGGYYFADLNTLIYGLAGLKWRQQSIQARFHCPHNHIPDSSGSKAKLINPRWVLGLGIERPIYKKLSAFMQYEYSWRSSKDTDTSLTCPKGDLKLKIKQQLKEHCFKLGINYHI